ncbi:MAG: prolyl oligopeptidase family serine peptidase, partial [Thermomicrobiales bacterium]
WLAVSVNEDGASRLALLNIDDPGHPIAIGTPWGTFDRFAWSPNSQHIGFGFSTSGSPSVVMISDLEGNTRTIASADELEPPRTVSPEVIRFTSFDGREIPAFWFTPEGDGPWPVIVDIHGGPESQRRLVYQPIDQYLVSLGFAVLSTNVRGSTGYGKEYVHLDDVDLRLDSVTDVAHTVDWLKARDDVASAQIIVMGQSYGGFMTLASLCFHPDLWAAGFDIVGIANFVTFLERTGPWRRKHREAEYGSLEHDRDLLERISPINHVDQLTAPLFLIHGRNDPRVPLFEAEQIHAALQERDRTVELHVFDDEGHGLSKRKNRVTGYAAAAGFLLEQLHVTPALAE